MSKKVCYHCGSTTGKFVEHEGKDFCCTGCATVYDILKENKLYTYYDLEINPGIKAPDEKAPDRYDYLDQEDIKKSVLDFYDGKVGKIRVYVPSIHCSSCIWLLENLGRINNGVLYSSVNFTEKEVSISFDESLIRLSDVMRLLESIHYKPYIQQGKERLKQRNNRSLLIKLGIAGFAFGNVMLLSFPDYLKSTIAVEEEFTRYFGWLSLLLSLPVLIYSASDYFLSAWKNLLKRIISIDLPIALGIATVFIRSVYELLSSSGTGYFDSLTGLVFFLLIGKWYQDKTYKALSFESDYTAYFPLGITRITGGAEEIVPIHKLKPGNLLRVHNQEIIPADSVLESEQATIDYSFITGESLPVQKQKGDKLFAGGRLLGSTIELIVENEVETSYLAQLWKDRASGDSDGTFISQALDTVSQYFTLAILTISTITAVYWLFVDPSLALIAFTSVLIVACPCALALSVPFTFGHAQRILGRNHLFLKHTSVIEKMAKVNTLVFDKTGTLTDSNLFEVKMDSSLAESGYLSKIKSLANQSLHPLSRAIYKAIDGEESVVKYFEESPGMGLQGTVGGSELKLGSPEFISDTTKKVRYDSGSLVLAKADGKNLGSFRIKNLYRNNWENLIENLVREYDFHLLSGDNDREKERIAHIAGSAKNLHFKQSPKDKLQYIKELRKQGKNVLMVGDGLNDAGALLESDLGIAVASDIYQFSPACDAIIQADSLSELYRFLEFSKAAKRVVWTSFIFSFLYNVVGIYFAASGKLSPLIAAILMPLSSVTIVVLTTVLTHFSGKRRRL